VIALFVALGGGAYAISIGKGDVKSKHIAKNAVKSKHIKNAKGVKGADVADGSLTGADLAPGTIGAAVKAYARVAPDGTISQAEGITQTQVSRPNEGTYCFGIEANHIQVSGGWIDGSGSPVQTIFALGGGSNGAGAPTVSGLCGPAATFMVGTGTGASTPGDSSFWVMFF
jgi:hypothetical protein